MLKHLLQHRDRIEQYKELFIPDIRWDGTRRRSIYLEQ
jgi:hypothetical protein